jgi:hypothetical protein
MKRMLCEMFTNRLGNVLAISHLSLIAINASGLGLIPWVKYSFAVNVPARIVAAIVFGEPLVPYWSSPTLLSKFGLFSLLFVYLQWISIGWIAVKIAKAIEPTLTKQF